MGANKSKLLESIESNQVFKFTNISINDLVLEDTNSPSTSDFNYKVYKQYSSLVNACSDQEEEEVVVHRFVELFKHDLIVNFADPSIGKEIAVLPTNHSKFIFALVSIY